jgi:hypothetical protein
MNINIYKITNLVNNKIYIGRTKHDITKRLQQHFTKSKSKNENFNYFIRSIQKHGSCNFKISLIEVCNESNMHEREMFYIKTSKSYIPDIGYNTTWVPSGSSGNVKRDVRNRLSESSKKYWNSVPKEQRSQILRDRTIGKKKSISHCNNISKVKTGIKNSKASSSYKGVAPCTNGGFRATFYYGNKCNLTIGNTKITEIDAASLWDTIVYKVYGETEKINFPEKISDYESIKLETFLREKFSHPKSKYKNISYHAKKQKYVCWQNHKYLKSFDEEIDAVNFLCNYLSCNEYELIRKNLSVEKFLKWYEIKLQTK